MKLFVKTFAEGFSENNFISEINNVSIRECLQYTSYGIFIGGMVSLFQGDVGYTILFILIAIFIRP